MVAKAFVLPSLMESCYIFDITAFFMKQGGVIMKSLTIKEIKIGDAASLTKTITVNDVETFASTTGDMNPIHMDDEYAKKTIFKQRIAHGMLVGSLFSPIFGVELPGLGSIYTKQSLKFVRPVNFGDTIIATVTVKEIIPDRNRVVFECIAKNQNEETVVTGEAEIMPPLVRQDI